MYTSSGLPVFSSNVKNHAAAIQRVHKALERDGEKLSPVDLCLSEAIPIKLPPLNWNLYHTVPISMTAKNSGFTVMINAEFDQETPYVNSGPLTDDYKFSQIHFHWGEHDNNGSGHAVSGVRYPLEMHVVHLKKKYANIGDALEIQDGIVVMVHLFGLRDDRNTQLDQLTAVLQFIQKNKSCARLYPTSLSELVHPFTNNYFLYRGAIGSPKGLYEVLWIVSSTLLPISPQQLEEFRKLYDPHGTLLLSNTSKPHPLDGRSLFLVSPSKRTIEAMYNFSCQPAQSIDDDKCIEIRNAEYKSLADLEEVSQDSSRMNTHPQLSNVENKKEGYFPKGSKGHTPTAKPYFIDSDDEGTMNTKLKYSSNEKGPNVVTNVNDTPCRHESKPRYDPSEAVYSVVSVRGSEMHLRRKQLFVSQNEPSTDDDCVHLNYKLRAHSCTSAPSLIDTRYFTIKANSTSLNDSPEMNVKTKLHLNNPSAVDISSSAPSLTDTRGCLQTNANNTNLSDVPMMNVGPRKGILRSDIEDKLYERRNNQIKDGGKSNSSDQLQSHYTDTDQKINSDKNNLKCYKKVAIQDFEIVTKNQNITTDVITSKSQGKPQRKNLGDSEVFKNRLNWYFKQDSGNFCNCLAEDQHDTCIKSKKTNIVFQKDITNKLVFIEKDQETIENGSHIPGLENKIPDENLFNHLNEHKVHYQNKEDNYENSKYYFWYTNKNEICLPKTSSKCIKNRRKRPVMCNLIYDETFLQKVKENNEKGLQKKYFVEDEENKNIHDFEKVENTNINADRNREQEKGITVKNYNVNKISPVKSEYDMPLYAIIHVDQLHNLNLSPKENNWNHTKSSSNIQRKANPEINKFSRSKLFSGQRGTTNQTHANYENLVLGPTKPEKIVSINNSVYANEYNKINLQTNEHISEINQQRTIEDKNNIEQLSNLFNRTKEICSGKNLHGTSKTIIGKFGKRESVEFFVRKNYHESLDYPKKDLDSQGTFKFVKTKHPNLSHQVEEPLKKPQALVIVKQLEQEITNQSENKPTEHIFDSKKRDIPEFTFDIETNKNKLNNNPGLIKNKLNNYNASSYRPSLAQQCQMETTFWQTNKNLPLNIIVDTENSLFEPNVANSGFTAKEQNMFHMNKENAHVVHGPLDENLTGVSNKAVQTSNKQLCEPVHEINVKYIFEEDSVHTSKKVEERKITRITMDDIAYKFPEENHTEHQNSESQHTVIIKKVEIPDPYFIIRIAKQPLVEYVAYNVYPTEIISETAETINEIVITRKKTFTMITEVNEAPNKSQSSNMSNISNEIKENNKDTDKTQLHKKETDFMTSIKNDENNQDFEGQNVEEYEETKSKIKLQNLLNEPKSEMSGIQNYSYNSVEGTLKEIKHKVSCSTSTSELLKNRLSDKNTSTTENEKPLETKRTTENPLVLPSIIIKKDNTEDETYDDLKTKPPSSQENNNVSQTVQVDKSLNITTETPTRDLLPRNKTDGDIIIHIHQGKVNPTVTVNINKPHRPKLSELSTQILQDHEIKPSSNPKAKLNKSKSSEHVYEKSSESSDNEETSGEEQFIRLVDYLLPLKNQDKTGIFEQETQRKSNNDMSMSKLNNINDALKPNNASKVDLKTSHYKLLSGSNGLNRSPVNIDMKSALVKKYPKLNFINHWNVEGEALLENNGKTLRGTFLENTDLPRLNGGPLTGEYEFCELHFHWGPKDCCGAEHIIDGQRYPLEGHFMYIKTVYENLQTAVEFLDGIVIVAVILKVGDPPNTLLEELIKDIPLIQDPGTAIYIPAWTMFAWVRNAVTEAKGYFSYKGVLTSQPPRVESVTWIVFPEPISFCCQQSRAFRILKSNKGEVLRKNFRHPHPLSSKEVVYFVPTD